jgi:Tol biopolymer transport system component
MAQPVDPKTMELKGDLFPVSEQVSSGPNPSDELYSISANGILVYQTGADPLRGRQHLWKDRTGKELGPAGGLMASVNSFALSPDRKRFVTQRPAQDRKFTNTDLWITDLGHSTDSRLTTDPSLNGEPIWSPDGTRVVFESTRGVSVGDLYQRASNGTGQDELLLKSNEPKLPWDWSRDGRFIVYAVRKQKGDDIWVLPMIGDKKPSPLLQSEFQKRQAQISPDERWLAYTSVESGRSEIYVVPFSPAAKADAKPVAGKWTVSTAGGTQPRWRDDGKELFYVAPDGKLMAAEIKATLTAFDRGVPQVLFDLRSVILPPNTADTGYVPAPDGKRFLIATTAGATAEAPPLTVIVNWLASVKK